MTFKLAPLSPSVGFYTNQPLWAGRDGVEAFLGKAPDDSNMVGFQAAMSEPVFTFDGKDWKLAVCRDGLIALQLQEKAQDLEEIWTEYIPCLNAAYLLLGSAITKRQNFSGLLEMSPITRDNALRFSTGAASLTSGPSFNNWLLMGRFLSSYRRRESIRMDMRILTRNFDLQQDTLSLFAADLAAAFESGLMDTLHLVLKAVSDYRTGDWKTALLLAWLVIEEELIARWKRFIDEANVTFPDKSKRINSDRQRCLENTATYTAAVMSNALELNERISHKRFRRIDRLRGIRNKVVHRDPAVVVSDKDAREAIEVALGMATENTSLEVRPDLSRALRGP